jgi:SMI1/KNR4 family protein SUKH-1
MDLSSLISCWQATHERHILNAGASDEEIVSVERELSLRLPESIRELYRFSDGLTLFGGELSIYPLRNATNELSLSRVTPWLRESNWPIPESVLIFGSTGTGEPIGLWTGPNSRRFPQPLFTSLRFLSLLAWQCPRQQSQPFFTS